MASYQLIVAFVLLLLLLIIIKSSSSSDPQQLPPLCNTGGDISLIVCAEQQTNITLIALSSPPPPPSDSSSSQQQVPRMNYDGCATLLLKSTFDHLLIAHSYTTEGRLVRARAGLCVADSDFLESTCDIPASAAGEFQNMKSILNFCCKRLGAPADCAAVNPNPLFFVAVAVAVAAFFF